MNTGRSTVPSAMLQWLRAAISSVVAVGTVPVSAGSTTDATSPPARATSWKLEGGAEFSAVRTGADSWGVSVSNAGLAAVSRQHPVEVEVRLGDDQFISSFAGYRRVTLEEDGFTGEAALDGPESSRFVVRDRWFRDGPVLRLARTVAVQGSAAGGFMSGVRFDLERPLAWTDAEWFIPGTIYGGFDHLTETAIGGRAHYRPDNYTVRIREDRLPAPLVLAHFTDDTWVAILNPAPVGQTTAAEGADVRAVPLMDDAFRFGAVGGQERDGKLSLGYWFPGSEGQVTYAGNTFPGGQLHEWRRRHHPIRDGFVQEYEICFRFGRGQPFAESMATVWRWAWDALNPTVAPHDIAAARRALVDVLAANVVEKKDWAGIPIFVDPVTGDLAKADRRAILGFCGKNLEAANYLLQEAALEADGPRSRELRAKAEAIAASFVRLKMSPPEGEGFFLDDGRPINSQLRAGATYLRSFGDDVKKLLQAYEQEKQAGRQHPQWLRWCREFAEWLLPQQRPDGGFPRAWKYPSGEVASASPNSSFNAVALLAHLARITSEQKYLDAAARAAEFCWANGQSRGRFVGGTIDNPDVLDKEAATLSLEAYLTLYEATGDAKWLTCAKGAADYAETWIYLWNVPMPAPEDPDAHWKAGVSTVGVQLIATGHSLVDQYMAFDADEFAKLYKYTGDAHYYDVARLLLHNTKTMLALPGRTYDLIGPGWQQEHWSMAPRRGRGMKRGWLPWVATSHLNGIFGLMNFDADLSARLFRADELK